MIFQLWNWYLENYSIVNQKPGILNNYIRMEILQNLIDHELEVMVRWNMPGWHVHTMISESRLYGYGESDLIKKTWHFLAPMSLFPALSSQTRQKKKKDITSHLYFMLLIFNLHLLGFLMFDLTSSLTVSQKFSNKLRILCLSSKPI